MDEINKNVELKMNILKNYYPKSYDMIVMYLFEEKTQNKIAEIYNTKQSCVSRNIKKLDRKARNYFKIAGRFK